MASHGCDQQLQVGIVAIVGSAGACTAMREILARLPANFPAPILYLQHLSPDHRGSLVNLLQYRTNLKVRWAEQGDWLRAGTVYLCPAGRSFFVQVDGTIVLVPTASRGDALHVADSFLASVAAHYAHRAVAIVLSGASSDGAEGVRAVYAQHGTVLVQDEASAFVWGMPSAALATGCVSLVLPLQDIAAALVNFVIDGHPLAALRALTAKCMGIVRVPGVTPVLRDTLAQFLDMALTINCTDLGNIQLVDRPAGVLAIVAQRGFGSDFLEHFRTVRMQDDSACGRAMRTRAPVLIADVIADPLFAVHQDIAVSAGFRAVQSTPLISRSGTVLGVLSTHFRSPRRLLPWELRRTEQYAKRVADMIDRLLIA